MTQLSSVQLSSALTPLVLGVFFVLRDPNCWASGYTYEELEHGIFGQMFET